MHIIEMSTLRPFARCRIGLAIIAAAMVEACGSTEMRLPSCWQASDLDQGSTFRGTVLILGGDDTRPSMFPMTCDGGVVADLPEGFTLPAPEKPPLSEPPERRFFQMDVVGKVVGVAFGRPSVQLEQVNHAPSDTKLASLKRQLTALACPIPAVPLSFPYPGHS